MYPLCKLCGEDDNSPYVCVECIENWIGILEARVEELGLEMVHKQTEVRL